MKKPFTLIHVQDNEVCVDKKSEIPVGFMVLNKLTSKIYECWEADAEEFKKHPEKLNFGNYLQLTTRSN